MALIQITPENVQNTSNDFSRKEQDIEAMNNAAINMMNNLRNEFKGNRANKIFAEWEGIIPKLKEAQASLTTASQILKEAANAFSQADGQ
jgi:WXG100 family type VII secretion target